MPPSADPQNWGFGEFDNWNSTSSMDKIFIMLPTNFTVPKANELLETFTKSILILISPMTLRFIL